MKRVTLTRDDLAQVIAERFAPQGYGGAVVTIPTDGGLAIEWACDWVAGEPDCGAKCCDECTCEDDCCACRL